MSRSWIGFTVVLNGLAGAILVSQFLGPRPATLHAQTVPRDPNEGGPGFAPPAPQAGEAAANEPRWDASDTVSTYANIARVTGTPEEVIVDFGLNLQPSGPSRQTIKVHPRVVLSYYTAKRLTAALALTLRRHEATFGPVDIDPRHRSRAPAARPSAPSGAAPIGLDEGLTRRRGSGPGPH